MERTWVFDDISEINQCCSYLTLGCLKEDNVFLPLLKPFGVEFSITYSQRHPN